MIPEQSIPEFLPVYWNCAANVDIKRRAEKSAREREEKESRGVRTRITKQGVITIRCACIYQV